MEKGHPFVGKVDWAESELDLQRSRTYVVRMNANQQNPRFEELIREVKEDLSPFVDVLVSLGPSTVLQVAFELARVTGSQVSADGVRLRLNRLVEERRVHRLRSGAPGRPYVYEVAPR